MPTAVRPHHFSRGWYALAIGGQLADSISTSRALHAGLVEGNPLMRPLAGGPLSYVEAVAIGTGAGYLGFVIDRRVQHRPGWLRQAGKAVPVIVGGMGFAMAVHNERLIAAQHRR